MKTWFTDEDDADLGTPDNPRNRLEALFWEYHAQNPKVYDLFDRFTKYAIQRGRTRFSVSVIVERIRWETTIETAGDDFKINNNHRAYYARLWMRNNPQYQGFFATREVRAA